MKNLFGLLFSISILFAQSDRNVGYSESASETVMILSESEFPVKPFLGETLSTDVEFCMESYQMSSQGFYEAITSLDNFHAVIRKTSEPCKYMVIFGGIDLEGSNVLYYSYIIRS